MCQTFVGFWAKADCGGEHRHEAATSPRSQCLARFMGASLDSARACDRACPNGAYQRGICRSTCSLTSRTALPIRRGPVYASARSWMAAFGEPKFRKGRGKPLLFVRPHERSCLIGDIDAHTFLVFSCRGSCSAPPRCVGS